MKQEDAEKEVNELMALIQQWGSTYNLAGGRFDDGTAFERSEALKEQIRASLLALRSRGR